MGRDGFSIPRWVMGIKQMECVGFAVALQRGAEWAATGKVTQRIPEDSPTATETKSRL